MNKLTPILLVTLCLFVAGCGWTAGAHKEHLEAQTASVEIIDGPTIVTKTMKDGTVIKTETPRRILAFGPRMKYDGKLEDSDAGIMRFQKLFRADDTNAPTKNKDAAVANLLGSPAITVELPTGEKINIGETKGIEATGSKVDLPLVAYIVPAIGGIVVILLLYKLWPYIMSILKLLGGKLGGIFGSIMSMIPGVSIPTTPTKPEDMPAIESEPDTNPKK